MQTRTSTLAACALLLSRVALGCGSDGSKSSCTPGASVECRGEGGCVGGQVCDAEGRGFSACVCGASAGPDGDGGQGDASRPIAGNGSPTVDGGGGDKDGGASSPGDDAGSDAGHDAGADAGTDAGHEPSIDFGSFACNPLTNVPCASDERCAWIQPASDPGLTGCLPDGTRSQGQTCSIDGDGVDDCERGLVCIAGTCEPSCVPGGDQCAPEGYCVVYGGLFSEGDDPALAGACKLGCSAITQLTSAGDACPDTEACFYIEYETGAVSTCGPTSPDTAAFTQDVAIEGTVFSNSCAPGFAPITDAAGDPVCTATCTPVETWSGSTANIGGEAPHTCADRGAGAGYECRFASYFAKYDHADPLLNAIGLCVNPAGRLYDSNGNGTPETPWPSCAELAKTDTDDDGVRDHEKWGCAPVRP